MQNDKSTLPPELTLLELELLLLLTFTMLSEFVVVVGNVDDEIVGISSFCYLHTRTTTRMRENSQLLTLTSTICEAFPSIEAN